jgi:hypothetical protein
MGGILLRWYHTVPHDGTIQYQKRRGKQPLRHEGSSPMMLIISILAVIGAFWARKRARAAGNGKAAKKGASV